jgi:uncharacterized protein (UPF0332 family)
VPDWRLWRDMADESLKAARDLQKSCPRSAVSRSYYGAYQAATAFLLYRKQRPPEPREAWSHADTPDMLREHLAAAGNPEGTGIQSAERLKRLYKLRLDADYISTVLLSQTNAQEACKSAGYIVKVIESMLPEK